MSNGADLLSAVDVTSIATNNNRAAALKNYKLDDFDLIKTIGTGRHFWIKGRIPRCGILRIFTVAFLVFIAPAG